MILKGTIEVNFNLNDKEKTNLGILNTISKEINLFRKSFFVI